MFEHRGTSALSRSRWAAIGAAVAVAIGAGGAGWVAHAAPGPQPAVFVSITPCRLFDTRPSTQVGDRATPLATGETWVRQVWGTNGRCTIPSTATGITYNLTVPDPPVNGFITVFPADAALPGSSSINPVANGGTKANSGTVGLSATGAIDLYNLKGPINALMDITGYFLTGSGGAPGPRGLSAWDVIPSGQTVTGEVAYDTHQGATPATDAFIVQLPGIAPTALTTTTVNFSGASGAADADATCAGSVGAPTAPAGQVCIYIDIASLSIGLTTLSGDVQNLPTRAFLVSWTPNGADNDDEYIYATWAYTAP